MIRYDCVFPYFFQQNFSCKFQKCDKSSVEQGGGQLRRRRPSNLNLELMRSATFLKEDQKNLFCNLISEVHVTQTKKKINKPVIIQHMSIFDIRYIQ